MQLALECPVSMLDMVQPFADFDWVLAHEVLNNETYKEYYKNTGKVKFLDSSVNELGQPLSVEDMKKADEELGGNCVIVSPDWIGDTNKTLEGLNKALEAFGWEKVVPVVQGSTFQDVDYCLTSIFNSAPKDQGGTIAIPYDICSRKEEVPDIMALRRAMVVMNIPRPWRIHLLGFVSLHEFYWYGGRPNVVSIDTGAPILLGLEGKDILDPLEDKKEPTYKRMEAIEMSAQRWTAICRNLALFRKFMP